MVYDLLGNWIENKTITSPIQICKIFYLRLPDQLKLTRDLLNILLAILNYKKEIKFWKKDVIANKDF